MRDSAKIQFQIADMLANEEIIFPASIRHTLEIRRMLIDPNSDIRSIAMSIAGDPIVSTAVLRLVNSPAYARNVKSVVEAVNLLGYSTLNFVVFGVLQKQMVRLVPLDSRGLVESLWNHSVNIAGSSFAIASTKSTFRVADEALMLSMLLHLDLMFSIYAASLLGLTPELSGEYSSVVRRAAQANRARVLASYGVEPDVVDSLTFAYSRYVDETLIIPVTATEALSLGVAATVTPEAVIQLIPCVQGVYAMTLEQNEIRQNIITSLL